MKQTLTLFAAILLLAVGATAQKLSYQAVVRNDANELVAGATVQVTVSILNATGNVQYAENHVNVQTNLNGLLSLMIGDGTPTGTATMADVVWTGASVKTIITLPGGASVTSVTPVNAVPYALYADNVNPANILTVPENVSAFNNDAGYISNTNDDCNNEVDLCELQNTIAQLQQQLDNIQGKLNQIPTVQTLEVVDISYHRCAVGGVVSDDGGAPITTVGWCWGTNPNPTIDNDYSALPNYLVVNPMSGDFYDSITNLLAGTTYYVRAYAKNSVGISYGNEVQFITTELEMPTVITGNITNIRNTSFRGSVIVISDGGSDIIEKGICWSLSTSPTTADAHIVDASTAESQLIVTGLEPATMYYIRAYAKNEVGTAYGDEVTITTKNDGVLCIGTPTVTDHEGNVYNTVQIGTQCWMKENMRATTSPTTGTYLIVSSPGITSTYTGKQARWYNNDSATYAPMNYGLLYNWNAAADTFNTAYGETSVNENARTAVSVTFNSHRRGICPAGWHLPSDTEWVAMMDYVSSQSEYLCEGDTSYIAKSLASETGWNNYSYEECCPGNQSLHTNNATGFSAVPAGTFSYGGIPTMMGNAQSEANFWSSSQNSNSQYQAYRHYLNNNISYVRQNSFPKAAGYSVRCLRD